MIRSVTTKLPDNLDVEMHVGIHRPHKAEGDQLVQTGDPFLVVEIWAKYDKGEAQYTRVTGMKMEDFVKLARDTVTVGKEIMAAAQAEPKLVMSGEEDVVHD